MNRFYVRNGMRYYKLNRDQIIEEGAMQSWNNGELQPIKNSDGETIGNTPSSFSKERDFYNPIRCVCGTHLRNNEHICHLCIANGNSSYCSECGEPLCDEGNCHTCNNDCKCGFLSNEDIGYCKHGYSNDDCPICSGGSE